MGNDFSQWCCITSEGENLPPGEFNPLAYFELPEQDQTKLNWTAMGFRFSSIFLSTPLLVIVIIIIIILVIQFKERGVVDEFVVVLDIEKFRPD